jgi:hypothetical protein
MYCITRHNIQQQKTDVVKNITERRMKEIRFINKICNRIVRNHKRKEREDITSTERKREHFHSSSHKILTSRKMKRKQSR